MNNLKQQLHQALKECEKLRIENEQLKTLLQQYSMQSPLTTNVQYTDNEVLVSRNEILNNSTDYKIVNEETNLVTEQMKLF